MVETGETVNITPTWRGILPALIELAHSNDPDARSVARTELYRMAMAADRYVATVGKPGVIATDVLTSEGLRP